MIPALPGPCGDESPGWCAGNDTCLGSSHFNILRRKAQEEKPISVPRSVKNACAKTGGYVPLYRFDPQRTAKLRRKAAVFVDPADNVVEVKALRLEIGEEGGTFKEGVGEATSELPPTSVQEQTVAQDGGPGEGISAADIAAVWQKYIDVMEPRSRTMGVEERRIIRDALKVASVDECKMAIEGCAASPFHMGQNDRGRRYNKLSQILRGKRGGKTTREQIDMFIEVAESQSGVHGFDATRITRAKRAVVQAHDMPGNVTAQERAVEATRWLEEHGWRVEEGPDGRPRFELS